VHFTPPCPGESNPAIGMWPPLQSKKCAPLLSTYGAVAGPAVYAPRFYRWKQHRFLGLSTLVRPKLTQSRVSKLPGTAEWSASILGIHRRSFILAPRCYSMWIALFLSFPQRLPEAAGCLSVWGTEWLTAFGAKLNMRTARVILRWCGRCLRERRKSTPLDLG
jgi:hypothetical protein